MASNDATVVPTSNADEALLAKLGAQASSLLSPRPAERRALARTRLRAAAALAR